jgi:hypothetical protein
MDAVNLEEARRRAEVAIGQAGADCIDCRVVPFQT